MIRLLQGLGPDEHPILEGAFRLRHSIFVDELKWTELKRPDGRDVDSFDSAHAIYLIALEKGDVVGHLRLLPTTRPHLLSEVYPQLCQRECERGPHVWEWSRACVSKVFREGAPFGRTLAELTLAAMEWGLANGVHDVLVEWHPMWISRFLELGVHVKPLGVAVQMGGHPFIAVQMYYDEAALDRLRRLHGTPVGIISTDQSPPIAPQLVRQRIGTG
jgi:acyl-homoserine lactone synthase